ncbi:hypothetical protein AKJ63_00650 [candidate division MSBL1 archaeon SCGC-AAA259D18]|uniref:Uncharacterized protein n=2 Tax=candidate division MSBL1 TaxID=215777 RepID=A0A133UBJ9_9EURY|nr:hypothetical protein AKJ57_00690 [candidate division MSBL1 archaeon SCGC-AAA259A05]KXA91850.1 hypothetical protein AKJ63_00650 [candidate division MSBL1 archaeon SCGC-AAA259D18]
MLVLISSISLGAIYVWGEVGNHEEETPAPINLNGDFFSELWPATLKVTDVQDPTAKLSSFRLLSNENCAVESLHFEFCGFDSKGIKRAYFVDLSPKSGQELLSSHSYEMEGTCEGIHPQVLYEELDKVDISGRVGANGKGISIWADFSSGSNNVYSCGSLYLLLLENGELKPLKKIVFSSSIPWCVIHVGERSTPENVVESENEITAEDSITGFLENLPAEERKGEIWFLSQDLDKAETVEYLQSENS